MKVLVLGAKGMAGHMIAAYLSRQGHRVDAMGRNNLDIENPIQVGRLARKLSGYDFVINCIGLLVKDCQERPDRAVWINTWWPKHLEHLLAGTATRLVHLSTDCVFNGSKGPYTETDKHTETNAYGRSKSLGEINNAKDITFRMSIIGPELDPAGTGLLNWILTSPESDLPGWDNAWWNGITTLELARCIDVYMNDPKIAGIYHLVNNQHNINKHDLLCLINEVYDLGKTVQRTKAPKNINKILIDSRGEIDFAIPDYQQQLERLRGWRH